MGVSKVKISEKRERPVHSAHIRRGPTMCQRLTAPGIQTDKASALRELKI